MFAGSILRHRNFRHFFTSFVVSHGCTMMQETALVWQVSLLAAPAERGLALGTVGLTRLAPLLALSLFGGAVADSVDRRKLVFVTQMVLMVAAAWLAYVTWTGVFLSLGTLYFSTAVKAVADAFDLPARQSLLPSLVPREEYREALNWMTVGQKSAVIVGPAVAGLVIAYGDIASVYAINAASFLGVLFTLVGLPASPSEARAERPSGFLTEGMRFLFADPLLRAITLLDFFAMVFGSARVLLPLIAQDVLHVGAGGYGWLRAAIPAGAWLAGVVMLRFSARIRRQGRAILTSVAIYSVATVGFGLSTDYWLSLFCLGVVGASDMVSTMLRSVLRQERTPDEMRGRVVSANSLFAKGGPELGQLEAGVVAQFFGVQASVVSGGIGALLVTALIAYRGGGRREGALLQQGDDRGGEVLPGGSRDAL